MVGWEACLVYTTWVYKEVYIPGIHHLVYKEVYISGYTTLVYHPGYTYLPPYSRPGYQCCTSRHGVYNEDALGSSEEKPLGRRLPRASES